MFQRKRNLSTGNTTLPNCNSHFKIAEHYFQGRKRGITSRDDSTRSTEEEISKAEVKFLCCLIK